MSEEWKLQVSYKTPSGELINVRAGSGAELDILLGDIAEVAVLIASVGATLGGVSNALPLSTPSSTAGPEWASSSPQASAPTPQVGGTVPTCLHGPRKFLSGVSKKNGKAYAMWVCQQPQGSQCEIVNG